MVECQPPLDHPHFPGRAPDRTAISGQVATYAKNGTLPKGDGIYAGGDSCIFSRFVNG